MIKAMYKVNIIESERGWGQKVDERHYFSTKKKAENFVEKYNLQNNQPIVPGIYWRAELIGVVDMQEEGKTKDQFIHR